MANDEIARHISYNLTVKIKPLDTSKEAQKIQREALRKLTPNQRIKMVFELTDELYSIIVAGIRARHPEFTEEDVIRERNRILWGDELYKAVYANKEKTH